MNSLPQPDLVKIHVGTTVVDGVEYPLEVKVTPYEYEPLTRPGEFRVLWLHARQHALHTPEGIIPTCHLENVLPGELPYLAVSYAWGDLSNYKAIPLSGNRYINVTKSLFALLCQLRPEDRMFPIWADQLCINQRDLAERAAQVKMMSSIYSGAHALSVWLGEDDGTVKWAVNFMQKLDCEGLSLDDVHRMRAKEDPSELVRVLRRNRVVLDATELGWTGLESLSRRPWFSRLWTFQEVVLANHLRFLCGSYDFGLEELFRAFQVSEQLTGITRTGPDSTFNIMLHRGKYYHSNRAHLMDFFRDTANGTYKCTDPRDRVYALLALQGQENQISILVDYTRPEELVFEEAANAITISKKGLDILYRRGPREASSLPSWVPNWSSDNFSAAINDDAPQTTFDCSRGLQHVFEEAPPGHLMTKGKIVATIAEMVDHWFIRYPFKRDYAGLKAFIGVTSLVPHLISKLENHAVCTGMSSGEKEAYVNWLLSTTLSRGFYRARDYAQFNTTNQQANTDLAKLLVADDPFGVFMMCKCAQRRIGLLDSATLPVALLPALAEPGDLVCVLNGANVPIVLRKRNEKHEFVGDCYVHGIMYGEAVAWTQDGGDTFDLV